MEFDKLAANVAILHKHNELRSSIANGLLLPDSPMASNMNRLQWDPALAQMAQDYADTVCTYSLPVRTFLKHDLL